MGRTKRRTTGRARTRGKGGGNEASRTVDAPHPGPEWFIQQIDPSSARNTRLVHDLFEEASSSKEAPHKKSRLRQSLVLLTGGSCDATLFVDENGKCKSARRVHAAVNELVKPYRMEHGGFWAGCKQVGRALERFGMYGAAAGHGLYATGMSATVLMPALIQSSMFRETFFKLFGSTNRFASYMEVILKNDVTRQVIGATGTVGGVYNLVPHIVRNYSDMAAKFRTIQLVNAVFQDGVSPKKLAAIKTVARELTRLDQQVAELLDNDERLRAKFHQFEREQKGFWMGGTNKSRVITLFRAALDDADKYRVSDFRRELMATGTTDLQGYHFVNVYGDQRTTPREIIAAYLLLYEHTKEVAAKLREKIPTVAVNASVRDAKRTAKRVGGDTERDASRANGTTAVRARFL